MFLQDEGAADDMQTPAAGGDAMGTDGDAAAPAAPAEGADHEGM
jgi:hypothetical protein